MTRHTPWGQGRLWPEVVAGQPRRYRVAQDGSWGPATTSLGLAIAQARAVAVAGGRAVICAHDGTGASVARGPSGFVIVTLDDGGVGGWPETVRRVLARYG